MKALYLILTTCLIPLIAWSKTETDKLNKSDYFVVISSYNLNSLDSSMIFQISYGEKSYYFSNKKFSVKLIGNLDERKMLFSGVIDIKIHIDNSNTSCNFTLLLNNESNVIFDRIIESRGDKKHLENRLIVYIDRKKE